jgi:hypothetical protein
MSATLVLITGISGFIAKLAGQAARDFVASTPGAPHYSSVNPGLVLGPALVRRISA